MKVNTQTLTGQALDWAVAKAVGHTVHPVRLGGYSDPTVTYLSSSTHDYFQPSTNWSQAGPLIEQHRISFDGSLAETEGWTACGENGNAYATGPTPLVAAMRSLVLAKLGNSVEIPEELL